MAQRGPRELLIDWARRTTVNGQPVSNRRVVADILNDANRANVRVPLEILNRIRVTRNNPRLKRSLQVAKAAWGPQGGVVVQPALQPLVPPGQPQNPYAVPQQPLVPLQPPVADQPLVQGFEDVMAQIRLNNPGLNIPQQYQNAPALPGVGPQVAPPAAPVLPGVQGAPAVPVAPEEKKDPLGYIEEPWAFKPISSLPANQQTCVTAKENISRMLLEELDRLGGNLGITWGLANFANTRNKYIHKFVGGLFKTIIKKNPAMAARIAQMYFDQETIAGSNPASRFYKLYQNQYDAVLREDIPFRINAQSFKFLQQMCQCTPSCNTNFHTNCFSYATVGLSSNCDNIVMENYYDYQNTRYWFNPARIVYGSKIKK